MSTSSFRCQLRCHQLRSSRDPIRHCSLKTLILWKCLILPQNGLFCFVLLFVFLAMPSSLWDLISWPGIKPMALKISVLTTDRRGVPWSHCLLWIFFPSTGTRKAPWRETLPVSALRNPARCCLKAALSQYLWSGLAIKWFLRSCARDFTFFSLE